MSEKYFQNILLCCGSRPGNEVIQSEARKIGEALGMNGHHLIYGGGPGLMDIVSSAVTQNGGTIKGVIPKIFASYATPEQKSVSDIVENLFERKQKMLSESDLSIVLPGAIGTWDEAIETACMNDMNKYADPTERLKPIIFLNTNGFWEAQRSQLERMIEDGFLDKESMSMFYFEPTAESVISRIYKLNAVEPARVQSLLPS